VQLLLIGAGVVVLLLVLAQLVLPRIAAGVVRGRLGGSDQVLTASVRALPAVQLLWGHADRVAAHVRSYDAGDVDIADELVQTTAVDELDIRIDRLRATRGLVLDDLRVAKRDGLLEGQAVLDPARLSAVLPAGIDARPVATDDGSVVLQGGGSLLGLGTSLRLNVVVTGGGHVVVRPGSGLLAALASYTLFADERVAVESLTATPLPDGRFLYRATARVTD
jgi:hypothetical protein